MSKLKASFTFYYTDEELDQQLNVLYANVIIEKPSARSVQLVHNFSLEALSFEPLRHGPVHAVFFF